jgi:hypothetical protein
MFSYLSSRDLRFSLMWHCVAVLDIPHVSKERNVIIFSVIIFKGPGGILDCQSYF